MSGIATLVVWLREQCSQALALGKGGIYIQDFSEFYQCVFLDAGVAPKGVEGFFRSVKNADHPEHTLLREDIPSRLDEDMNHIFWLLHHMGTAHRLLCDESCESPRRDRKIIVFKPRPPSLDLDAELKQLFDKLDEVLQLTKLV